MAIFITLVNVFFVFANTNCVLMNKGSKENYTPQARNAIMEAPQNNNHKIIDINPIKYLVKLT